MIWWVTAAIFAAGLAHSLAHEFAFWWAVMVTVLEAFAIGAFLCVPAVMRDTAAKYRAQVGLSKLWKRWRHLTIAALLLANGWPALAVWSVGSAWALRAVLREVLKRERT